MSVTPLKIRFGKLLKDCLKNTDYRQNDLAARLQVTGSAVSQMMHGKIVPNQQQLDAICEMLALDRAKVFELNSMLSRIRTGAENHAFSVQPDVVRAALPAGTLAAAAFQPLRGFGRTPAGV